MKILVKKSITNETVRTTCVQLYFESFNDSQYICSQEQRCYDYIELQKALLDSDYLKFLAYEKKVILAMALMTNNIDKARIAYINPEKYQQLFPKQDIFYITYIGTTSSKQQQGYASAIIKEIIRFSRKNDHSAVYAFDFSQNKNSTLPQLILTTEQRLAKEEGWEPRLTYKKIDCQEYGVLIQQ